MSKDQMPSQPRGSEERATQSKVDTITFTAAIAKSWAVPSFQRPVIVNARIQDLAEAIAANGGVIPGIVTFGVLNDKVYLIDGQQRRNAFLMSGKPEGFADVRYRFFETLADMAEEFVRLNSHLVNMTPDDMLRGMEPSFPWLATIRKECPFIGYGHARRPGSSILVSMSALVRSWYASSFDSPQAHIPGTAIVERTNPADVPIIVKLLQSCHTAWGRDKEYLRLWAALNLTLTFWLYRRAVLVSPEQNRLKRRTIMTHEEFQTGLYALSASATYLDWLQGRRLADRDLNPCYNRMKTVFGARLRERSGNRILFPVASWETK